MWYFLKSKDRLGRHEFQFLGFLDAMFGKVHIDCAGPNSENTENIKQLDIAIFQLGPGNRTMNKVHVKEKNGDGFHLCTHLVEN